jgi:3-methylcrotonyl-CoA carboxylase alpha subunit
VPNEVLAQAAVYLATPPPSHGVWGGGGMLNRRFGGEKEMGFELDGRHVNVSSTSEGFWVKIGEWETTLTTSSPSIISSGSQSSAIASDTSPLEHTAQFPHTRQTSTIIPFSHKLHIFTSGKHHILTLPTITSDAETKTASQDVLKSPMPATVIEVRVQVGESVKEGQVCAVLESMKMEISIRAGRDGVVGRVGVEKGDVVEEGAVLVALSPEGEKGDKEV